MSTMGYVTTLTGAEDAANLSLDFTRQIYRVLEGGKFVNKNFSDIFSFARSTTGGRFNDKGRYETVVANQPRFDYDPITKLIKGLLIEEQRTNLATFSNDMRLWGRTRVSIAQNSAVAPDGKLSASKIVSSTTADWHYTSSPTFAVANATTYVQTVYAKAGEWPRIRLGFMDNNVFSGAVVFDLTTGARVSGTVGDITPVGDGWYRCSYTGTSKIASNSGMSINPVKAGEAEANTAGDGVSGIYVWGAQVEQALAYSSYIPAGESFTSRSTTATYYNSKGVLVTAGINVPRINAYDYDVDGNLLQTEPLYESATTNIIRDSNHFRGVIWNRASGVILSTDGTTAPDGTIATRVDLIGADAHNINQPLPAPLTSVQHTLSIWVKARVGAFPFQMAYYGDGVSQNSKTIVPTAEWKRHSFTFTPFSAGVAGPQIRLIGFSGGAAGDSCYIFGAQLQSDAVMTSYVPAIPNFTGRASTATYFDSEQIMQTAPVNVPRDNAYAGDGAPMGLFLENSATNLLSVTEGFGLPGNGWGRQSVAIAASGTVAPTGVGFYDEITINGTAGTPALNKLVAAETPASTVTQSYHVKAGTTDKCSLRFYDTIGEGGRVTFDLSNGTIQSTQGAVFVAATINKLKDGAYRISLTCDYTTRSRGGLYVYLIPDFNAPVIGKSVLAWGGQLEAGKEVTSYIPAKPKFTTRTTTATYIDSDGIVKTAAVNVERTDAYGRANNGSLVRIGQLLEGASTNLITYSNLVGGAWGNANSGSATIVVTANAAISPDGTMNATKLDFSAKLSGETQLRRFQVTGLTDQSWLANSIWLRADSPTTISLRLGAGGQGLVEVNVGTEWTLFKTPTGLNTGTSYNFDLSVASNLAAPVGRTIYAWGAQLEVSSNHTSTIPTSGATGTRAADGFTMAQVTRAADVYSAVQATRAADVCNSVATTRTSDVLSANKLSPWFSSTSGTLTSTVVPGARIGGTRSVTVLDDGTQTNRIALFDITGGGNATGRLTLNGTEHNTTDLVNAFLQDTVTKTAVSWSVPIGFTVSVGGKISSTSVLTVIPNVTTLRIGSSPVGGSFNGHFKSVNYYQTRLSNSQLQLLTE